MSVGTRVLSLVVMMVITKTYAITSVTSSSTTTTAASSTKEITLITKIPACNCPAVNCKTCSMEKGACCRWCCNDECVCHGLNCASCNGTLPCCQVCCQEGPWKKGVQQKGNSTLTLPAELVLSNVTVVINQPQIVVRAPHQRPPALCCNVDEPDRCSPYGCVAGKTSVKCGPQCLLGRWRSSSSPPAQGCPYPWSCQVPQGQRCTPLYNWPYFSCPSSWPWPGYDGYSTT